MPLFAAHFRVEVHVGVVGGKGVLRDVIPVIDTEGAKLQALNVHVPLQPNNRDGDNGTMVLRGYWVIHMIIASPDAIVTGSKLANLNGI